MSALDAKNPVELGGRLKAARNAARITQEEAANAIGVARTTLVAIERGERQIRSTEITKLAEIYGVSVNSLLRESAVHLDLVPQFRRSMTAKDDEDTSSEAARTLQRLASLSVELERALGRKREYISFPEYRINKTGWQEQAEDLALQLRQQLGVGSGPIADIFVLAEVDMGIRLFVQRLSSKISGVFAYQDEIGACILLNSAHPVERRAWTCAHEIAHLLTNRHAADIVWMSGAEKSLDERFADRFAAAFLMPASVVRLRFAEIQAGAGRFSPRHLVQLARTFNVSVEAMARRLEQLNLLANGTFDSLVEKGFSVKDANKLLGIPAPQQSKYSPRLTDLVLEAYRKAILTEAQAAEILGLDQLSVRRLLATLLEESGEEEDSVNGWL